VVPVDSAPLADTGPRSVRGRGGSRGGRGGPARPESTPSATPSVPRPTTPALRYEPEPKKEPAPQPSAPKPEPPEGGSLLKRITGALKRSVMGDQDKPADD